MDKISRRTLLKGVTLSQLPVWVGLPPLAALFNSHGTAYAADAAKSKAEAPVESRFVFWFNGNGVVEKYWIPEQTGADYTITPCLTPLAPFKQDIHIITGLDNP